jgi:hypothetical protein
MIKSKDIYTTCILISIRAMELMTSKTFRTTLVKKFEQYLQAFIVFHTSRKWLVFNSHSLTMFRLILAMKLSTFNLLGQRVKLF